jgi:hypothetical protein
VRDDLQDDLTCNALKPFHLNGDWQRTPRWQFWRKPWRRVEHYWDLDDVTTSSGVATLKWRYEYADHTDLILMD